MSEPVFVVDAADPRAPTQAEWDAMSEAERDAVVAMLPSSVPLELHPPEGDPHRDPKDAAREALSEFYRRIGRRIYVSSELATYYPAETRFCPDVLAVLDVEPHKRSSWIVSREGKGLDFVLEIHVGGDAAKDFTLNVERYARLCIPEYFIFDQPRDRLVGYRLRAPDARVYERLVPQAGRLRSSVLDLDLTVEGGRVRFYYGSAPLLFVDELVGKLERMVSELVEARDAAARRAEEESRRADREAARTAELADEVARLRAELERGGSSG